MIRLKKDPADTGKINAAFLMADLDMDTPAAPKTKNTGARTPGKPGGKPSGKKTDHVNPGPDGKRSAPLGGNPESDQNDNKVYFVAMGGLEHVGQNMYVYKHKGKYLVIDAGMGFLESEFEGADLKYPETTWLEKHKKDVVAFVITHGHEDHIGAMKYIWPKFKCPIYCTRFVAEILRRTFTGSEIAYSEKDINVFDQNGASFAVGPFDIETFHVSHSLPEAQMIIIKTAAGKILHTGDWTFNDDNPIEPMTDYVRLREIGSDPMLLAVVGDSTSVDRQLPQTTEMQVKDTFVDIFARAPGRVLVTGYSRSIARLKMFSMAAKATNRMPAIKERSSTRPVPYVGLPEFREIGMDMGYLAKDDLFLHSEIRDLPAEKQAIFLTGSQGEKYAMLTRLTRGDVKEMQLQPTDTVIFSAIIIPGNEKEVSTMYNKLAKLGVHVHTIFDTNNVHASGHAGRPEYERFFDMVHPQTIIPMHGEYMTEMLHAKMGMERGGAKHMMLVKNGEMIALQNGEQPYVSETVHTGFIVVEGDTERAGTSPIFKTRKKMMLHGAVFVTLPVDKRGFLKGVPEVSSAGIFEADGNGLMKRQIQLEITKVIDAMGKGERKQEKNLENAVRTAVNGVIRPVMGREKKPDITVHFVQK